MSYTKSAHERQRKTIRQRQRSIVINWATLANATIEAFIESTRLELFSTSGRRLRVLDEGKYRPLRNREFAELWTITRQYLLEQGSNLTVRKIETGLKAVGLIAPLPMGDRKSVV